VNWQLKGFDDDVDVFSQVISPVHGFSVFHSTDQLRNTRSDQRSRDLRSHPVAMLLLLLRKKRGKKPDIRRTYFRSRPLPVTWLCHFRSKDPTRTDMAQLSVAHAQNILPVKATSGQGHFRSRDFRLLHRIAPPQILICPCP
jgi:hypothetical protein